MHPQMHGRAEEVVQDIADQIKKMKVGLERQLNGKIPIFSHVVHWMVEHVVVLVNMHQLGHVRKIAHRKVHQRDAPVSQFVFGQQMFARFASKRSNNKRQVPLAPRSILGIWVGINEAISENIVVSDSGRAIRVRIAF